MRSASSGSSSCRSGVRPSACTSAVWGGSPRRRRAAAAPREKAEGAPRQGREHGERRLIEVFGAGRATPMPTVPPNARRAGGAAARRRSRRRRRRSGRSGSRSRGCIPAARPAPCSWPPAARSSSSRGVERDAQRHAPVGVGGVSGGEAGRVHRVSGREIFQRGRHHLAGRAAGYCGRNRHGDDAGVRGSSRCVRCSSSGSSAEASYMQPSAETSISTGRARAASTPSRPWMR